MKQFSAAVVTAAMLMVGAAQVCYAGDTDKAKLDERMESAREVIDEVLSVPDKGIPQSILRRRFVRRRSSALQEGAFVVGAQYGQGVATCRTGHGWSAPVFVKLEGGSFGWQIGGQSTDLISWP